MSSPPPVGGFVLTVTRGDLEGKQTAWVVPEQGDDRGINVALHLKRTRVDLRHGGWARYEAGVLVELGVPAQHRVEFREGPSLHEILERMAEALS